MKKIAIITIIDNLNFGNRLQNYAVQCVLEKYKFKINTIKNYARCNNKNTNLFKLFIWKILFGTKMNFLYLKQLKKYKNFTKFNNNIKFSKKIETIHSINDNNYDYFITGSDQVWNPNFRRLTDIDLLSFAEPNKRISFSASFGIDKLPTECHEKARRELSKFKAISVREDVGKGIIHDVVGRDDVDVLVDPTMLLSTKEWDKVSKRPKIQKNKKYILNYFLGELSNERKQEIERIAKENNCDVVNLLDKTSPFYECGPSEFIYLEKNAFLICTDSFHSAVFAILYNKPFLVFEREDKNEKMNSRLETLLKKFELESQKYSGQMCKDDLNIDYKKTNKILEQERKKACNWLKSALDIK